MKVISFSIVHFNTHTRAYLALMLCSVADADAKLWLCYSIGVCVFVVSRLLCVITSTNRFRLTLSNEERKKHAKMCMEKFNRNFTLKKSKLHQWIRAMNFQCEFSGCIEILTLSNFARKVFSSAFVIPIFLLLLCCYCRCHKKKIGEQWQRNIIWSSIY